MSSVNLRFSLSRATLPYHYPLFFYIKSHIHLTFSSVAFYPRVGDKVAAQVEYVLSADDFPIPCVAIDPTLFRTTSQFSDNKPSFQKDITRSGVVWNLVVITPNKEFERFVEN